MRLTLKMVGKSVTIRPNKTDAKLWRIDVNALCINLGVGW